MILINAEVAQLVEHIPEEDGVAGSSPALGTTKTPPPMRGCFAVYWELFTRSFVWRLSILGSLMVSKPWRSLASAIRRRFLQEGGWFEKSAPVEFFMEIVILATSRDSSRLPLIVTMSRLMEISRSSGRTPATMVLMMISFGVW
jgi:hypothetical protein